MKSSRSPSKLRNRFPKMAMTFFGFVYFLLIGCIVAYIWLFTQDRFISVASFKISRQNPSAGELGIAALALPGLTDSGSVDSQIAIGFVNSTDMLLRLEKEFKLREHYGAPTKDFVFRLAPDALVEQRLDFYRKRIFAHYDKETGLTMLTTDTFDPKLSKQLAESVLKQTEDFINKLNQTVADQQSIYTRSEVERSEKQVSDIMTELLTLQNDHNLVSPEETISASLQMVQQLRMERLRAETTLASIERDSPVSPRINSLRSQLRSLDEQIAVESTKISGPEKDRLNQVLAKYKELEMKLEFANHLRTGAATLLEKNRMEAVAQSRFISVIQSPFLPEDVGYPLRPYSTATIIGLSILLFLVLKVLVQSIFERAA